MTENEKYIFDHFIISIKAGFESLEDIIANAQDMVDDEGWGHEVTEVWIREVLTREYNKNQEASKSWSHPTDLDRLQVVFDTLSSLRIIALHNAGVDASDAMFDVQDIWIDAEDEGLSPVGYCFYSEEDLEQAINEDQLDLHFGGAKENDDKKSILIGNIIREELTKAGFEVSWNNTASQPISIVNFNWQNAFVSDEDADEKWTYDRTLVNMRD